MKKEIFTVGHSNHDINIFIDMLKKNNINTIVDVRSSPYSQYSPQYNQDILKNFLKKSNIQYIFMGNLLGARYEDKNLLFHDKDNKGKVNFQKVQETKGFQDGITRLEDGVKKGYSISLMCSEKDALDCHRFGLVSKFLYHKNSFEINHIYTDSIFNQQDIETKLLNKFNKKLPQNNLFDTYSDTDLLDIAYQLQNLKIAYNPITKEGDHD
jgi:uncharacterized protein (DUF488 family)